MKAIFLVPALLAFCLGASYTRAQTTQAPSDPILLTTKYDEEKDEFLFLINKRVLGNYSLAVDFLNPGNIAPPSQYRTSVRSSGVLMRLKPLQPHLSAGCGLRYVFILGDNQARPDSLFAYRLPFSPLKGDVPFQSSESYDSEFFKFAVPKVRRACHFELAPGDTVYAARKGRVVDLENDNIDPGRNVIRIEQPDGTIANYSGLARGSALVKKDEMVFPETPLACMPAEGEKAMLSFFVYYIENTVFTKGNAYNSSRAFTSAFIDPVFTTAWGSVKLESGRSYTAKITPEMQQLEMTKKELKSVAAK